MNLIFTTEDFKINEISYGGFPLVLDRDMNIQAEVFEFLIYECIIRGRVQSKASWAAYGQSMYDYFSYLEANKLPWDPNSTRLLTHCLTAYRDWSIREHSLRDSTINYRLRLVLRFYEFAIEKDWLRKIDLETEAITPKMTRHFLAHTSKPDRLKISPIVLLREKSSQIKVLSIDEIQQFMGKLENTTQRLIAHLGLATGLRRAELVSFPLSYVVNPARYSKHKSIVRVHLDPNEMILKGNRPRSIDVPRRLMQFLWEYLLFDRAELQARNVEQSPRLFLTHDGQAYANNGKSLNNLWRNLDLPFRVTPHTLRHTYATHTLFHLKKKHSIIDPLLYLRERLGHSSVSTTERYLHHLSAVDDRVLTEYQNELDSIMQTK